MKNWIFLCFSIFIIISCDHSSETHQKSSKANKALIREALVKTNKHLVKVEDRNIKDFIERYGYEMKETGSGLFYQIYKRGTGEKTTKNKIAELNFSVRLLNGKVIYNSENEGIKEFEIGKGGVESGLEEGILLLSVGDRARFIIPSHLAFGLLGDLEKIPEKSTIVYDVELLNLKEK